MFRVSGDRTRATVVGGVLWSLGLACAMAVLPGCADGQSQSCEDGWRWAERQGQSQCWRICGVEPGCRRGERCEGGLCLGSGDAGTTDGTASSCGEGERRVVIGGSPTCASTCESGESCAPTERCFEGYCVAESQDAGTTDTSTGNGGGGGSCEPGACGPGEACIDGACRNDPDDDCSVGADRVTYRGRTGCRARCSSNSECAGDSLCRFEYCLRPDDDEDGCEPHADPVEWEGRTSCRDGCVRDANCTRVQVCRDGYCVPE